MFMRNYTSLAYSKNIWTIPKSSCTCSWHKYKIQIYSNISKLTLKSTEKKLCNNTILHVYKELHITFLSNEDYINGI